MTERAGSCGCGTMNVLKIHANLSLVALSAEFLLGRGAQQVTLFRLVRRVASQAIARFHWGVECVSSRKSVALATDLAHVRRSFEQVLARILLKVTKRALSDSNGSVNSLAVSDFRVTVCTQGTGSQFLGSFILNGILS